MNHRPDEISWPRIVAGTTVGLLAGATMCALARLLWRTR